MKMWHTQTTADNLLYVFMIRSHAWCWRGERQKLWFMFIGDDLKRSTAFWLLSRLGSLVVKSSAVFLLQTCRQTLWSPPEKKEAAAFCANFQWRPEKVISWLSWWGQKDILAMLDSWGFDRCQWPHKRWAASNTRSFHLQLRSSFPWLVGLMYLLNILRTRSSAVMRRTSWG